MTNFASELVGLKVDVIFAGSNPAVLAAKNATTTIPIVMTADDDPVRVGLVASLARPGGNVTGLTHMPDVDIVSKRLHLLTQVVPDLRRVALLRDPSDSRSASVLAEMKRVAGSLRIQVRAVDVRGPNELERAVAPMARDGVGAVVVGPSGMLYSQRPRLTTVLATHKLPAMFSRRDWVESGGLLSYGADNLEVAGRAAIYVDKILKGAKPGDLPVEQPTRFELVINLKTAKALGLTLPSSLLLRADHVIE